MDRVLFTGDQQLIELPIWWLFVDRSRLGLGELGLQQCRTRPCINHPADAPRPCSDRLRLLTVPNSRAPPGSRWRSLINDVGAWASISCVRGRRITRTAVRCPRSASHQHEFSRSLPKAARFNLGACWRACPHASPRRRPRPSPLTCLALVCSPFPCARSHGVSLRCSSTASWTIENDAEESNAAGMPMASSLRS